MWARAIRTWCRPAPTILPATSASGSARAPTARRSPTAARSRRHPAAGTSVIGDQLSTSTGTISAASGDLQFSGPTNSISGTLSGAGQISFAGGVTFLGTVALSVGTLGIYGSATVNLGTNLTFSHVLNDSSNGTTDLNLGAHTFTLSGPSAAFVGANGTADITGSGTLSNKQRSLTLNNVILGGTVALSNAKTIDQVGQESRHRRRLAGAPCRSPTSAPRDLRLRQRHRTSQRERLEPAPSSTRACWRRPLASPRSAQH